MSAVAQNVDTPSRGRRGQLRAELALATGLFPFCSRDAAAPPDHSIQKGWMSSEGFWANGVFHSAFVSLANPNNSWKLLKCD